MGYLPYQLVQDFFHQQYQLFGRVLSINTEKCVSSVSLETGLACLGRAENSSANFVPLQSSGKCTKHPNPTRKSIETKLDSTKGFFQKFHEKLVEKDWPSQPGCGMEVKQPAISP